MSTTDDPPPGAQGRFATTRWSLVAAAAQPADPRAGEALAYLCETYWFPVYAYVRRSGHDAASAEDLTQAFFTRLLERHDLAGADASLGRFRAYLLGAVRHFLSGERRRENAQRRGGGRALFSLDFEDGERRLGAALEPSGAEQRPDQAFERAFALTLLEAVLEALAAEQAERGRAEEFELLRPALTPGSDQGLSQAHIAAALGTTEGAVKTRAHRLRRRYAELLRLAIAETLPAAGDVEEEIRALFRVLA